MLSLIIFVLPILCIRPATLAAQGNPGDHAADLSSPFRCPEDYPSIQAKQSALRNFLQAYAARFPKATVHDLFLYRYRLLVAHSCHQTLQYMLGHVSPTTEMLRFQNQNYGPKVKKFDPATKVWSAFYVKDGERPGAAKEELIFNFCGRSPPRSPESVAKSFTNRSDNVKILRGFAARDSITKSFAYFFVSETTYPQMRYAYANITKINSAGSSAYSVTFTKEISGTGPAGVDHNVRSWLLSEEGKATTTANGLVGVGASWREHLTNPHDNRAAKAKQEQTAGAAAANASPSTGAQAVPEGKLLRPKSSQASTVEQEEISAAASERLSPQQLASILQHQSDARTKAAGDFAFAFEIDGPALAKALNLHACRNFLKRVPRLAPGLGARAQALLGRLSSLQSDLGKSLVPRTPHDVPVMISLFDDCYNLARIVGQYNNYSRFSWDEVSSFRQASDKIINRASNANAIKSRVLDEAARMESYPMVMDRLIDEIKRNEQRLDSGDYDGAYSGFHGLADLSFLDDVPDQADWTNLSPEEMKSFIPALHEYLDRTAALQHDLNSYGDATRLHRQPAGSVVEQVKHLAREQEFMQASESKPITRVFLEAAVASDKAELKKVLDGLPSFEFDKGTYEMPKEFATTTPTNAQRKAAFLKEKIDELNSELAGVQKTNAIVMQPQVMAVISQLLGNEASASLKLKVEQVAEAERQRAELVSDQTTVQAQIGQYQTERERRRAEQQEAAEDLAIRNIPTVWPKSQCIRAVNNFFKQGPTTFMADPRAINTPDLLLVSTRLMDCANNYSWTYEERNQLAIPLPFSQLADKEQQWITQAYIAKVVNFIRQRGLVQQFAWEVGHNTISLDDCNGFLDRHHLNEAFATYDMKQSTGFIRSQPRGVSTRAIALFLGVDVKEAR